MTHFDTQSARPGRVGGRLGRGRAAIAMRVLLILGLATPAIVLGAQLWRSSADAAAQVERERHGLAYLSTLVPFTAELFKAQASAVDGRPGSSAQLVDAADKVGVADAAWGVQLRTHERWVALRKALDSVRDKRFSDAAAAQASFAGLADQLIELYARVRDQADLMLDADPQTHYLLEAATVALPRGMAAVTAYVVQTRLALSAPQSAQSLAAVISVRDALEIHADDVSELLEQAIAVTHTQDLGKNLIAQLNSYRQSTDLLVPATEVTTITAATVADADLHGQAAVGSGIELNQAILAIVDGQLAGRAAAVTGRQWLASGTIVGAALLATVVALLWLRGDGNTRLRRRAESVGGSEQSVADARQELQDAAR